MKNERVIGAAPTGEGPLSSVSFCWLKPSDEAIRDGRTMYTIPIFLESISKRESLADDGNMYWTII